MPPPASQPENADPPVLSLDGVSFGYASGRPVVRELTAGLRPGRITALIGPNAAGKTTALRLMLGHLTPWEGTVTLTGRAVDRWPPLDRARRVSYVPQRGAVSFAFTVRQVVAMGRFSAAPRKASQDAGTGGASGDGGTSGGGGVDWALSACELTGLADRVFAHLSGGQQQRVLLARAMAQARGQGVAMLLDEPAAGMDLWHVHQTMARLRELAQQGLAVLVVVHDLNLAGRYADEVWLMDQGRLVAQGPWDTVLTPEQLEPVYRVPMRRVTEPPMEGDDRAAGAGRPVLLVDPGGTLGGVPGPTSHGAPS